MKPMKQTLSKALNFESINLKDDNVVILTESSEDGLDTSTRLFPEDMNLIFQTTTEQPELIESAPMETEQKSKFDFSIAPAPLFRTLRYRGESYDEMTQRQGIKTGYSIL